MRLEPTTGWLIAGRSRRVIAGRDMPALGSDPRRLELAMSRNSHSDVAVGVHTDGAYNHSLPSCHWQ